MAGRRKLGSASLKTGRLIWPCLAGERGPDGRGKWPYASTYESVWKSLLQFVENDKEKLLLNSLIDNAEEFENLEKPRSGATFCISDEINLGVDLLWTDSKVMFFSCENEDEYTAAKDGDWKCIYAGDESVTWEKIKNLLKEK